MSLRCRGVLPPRAMQPSICMRTSFEMLSIPQVATMPDETPTIPMAFPKREVVGEARPAIARIQQIVEPT